MVEVVNDITSTKDRKRIYEPGKKLHRQSSRTDQKKETRRMKRKKEKIKKSQEDIGLFKISQFQGLLKKYPRKKLLFQPGAVQKLLVWC